MCGSRAPCIFARLVKLFSSSAVCLAQGGEERYRLLGLRANDCLLLLLLCEAPASAAVLPQQATPSAPAGTAAVGPQLRATLLQAAKAPLLRLATGAAEAAAAAGRGHVQGFR